MSETQNADSRIGSIRDAARVLGVPRSFLYERTRHGRLPGAFKVGKLIRVDLDALLSAAKMGELK